MTPKFKFLRRVRIHGGECGAVARALHHDAQKVALIQTEQSLISDEKALLSQADSGKALGSTFNERKQMSTKTTLKRIALVAVSALGFGLLAAVPSAQATGRTAASISVGTIPPARVGEAIVVPVTIYLPAAAVENDTITISAQLTAAPLSGGVGNVASAGRPAATAGNDAAEVLDLRTTGDAALGSGTNETGRTTSAGTNCDSYTGNTSTNTQWACALQDEFVVTAAAAELGYVKVGVKLTPDVAGSYTVMVATNATGNDGFVAGSPTANFTVTTSGSPTSVTITNVRGSSILAGSPNGALVKLTLNGALSGLENICLTTSGDGEISKNVTTPSFSTTQTLSSTDFSSGAAHVLLRHNGTAAQTIELKATGCGALDASVTALTTYAVTAQAGSSTVFLTFENPSATSVYSPSTMAGTIAGGAFTVAPSSTSQSFGLTGAANTAAKYGYATVTDTGGTITGVASAKYDQMITYGVQTAAAGTSFSVAGNCAAVATGACDYSVTIKGGTANFFGTDGDKTFTVDSAARTNAGGFTLTPSTTFVAAPGTAITISGELADQFGVGRGAQEVTITTSGRNNPVATKVITVADGTFSFTTADASTSTTNLVDTVTFSATGATSATVTINYANTAVGTVTVTGGNTTASVTSLVTTVNPISIGSTASTGTTGPEAGAITITATVKDANGNALAGVPVSFSVAGTGVAFTTPSATKYTGATGTAAGSLYAWLAGTYTYTVTAGGKTTTGTATFGSTTNTNARVVSATVAGSVVTGKVVDRFGNPVKSVVLYATTGTGANIGGVFVKDATTDANGEAKWVVSGSGSVTVSAVNPADSAGTTFGQTCALAGNRNCATASVAAVAYGATTAGTATTAEKNVGGGTTYAPAGVASATVSVTAVDAAADAANAASDAAAEAIDAANAATDAANLAAEAADAATVAAEEARDAADAATAAVEELATQVATLMAALKAQITTLANTVAKIAKKVKA